MSDVDPQVAALTGFAAALKGKPDQVMSTHALAEIILQVAEAMAEEKKRQAELLYMPTAHSVN